MPGAPLIAKCVQTACLAAMLFAPTLANAEDNPTHYQTMGGVTGYIGVVPAEIVKGHPPGHPEATMHGGVPPGPHEHHLIVALFDAGTNARITNANVTVTIFGPGNTQAYGQAHLRPWGDKAPVVSRTPLEPMQIAGTVTYGGFFRLPQPVTYTIQVVVNRPGKTKPSILNFAYDDSADAR